MPRAKSTKKSSRKAPAAAEASQEMRASQKLERLASDANNNEQNEMPQKEEHEEVAAEMEDPLQEAGPSGSGNDMEEVEENAEEPKKRGRGRPADADRKPKEPKKPLTPEEKEARKQAKIAKKAAQIENGYRLGALGTAKSLAEKEKRAGMNPEELKAYLKEYEKIRKANTREAKAELIFPIARCHRYLKKGTGRRCMEKSAVFTAAVMEYLCAEVVELSGNVAHEHKRRTIKPRDIMVACRNDDEINRLIGPHITFGRAGVRGTGIHPALKESHLMGKMKVAELNACKWPARDSLKI